MQLTNETVEESVAMLSQIVAQSQENEVDQTEDNLNTIAQSIGQVANFVTESNVMINENV